jgi:hypothetical protein
MCRLVAVQFTASGTTVYDHVALLGVGLHPDWLHLTLTLTCAVTGKNVKVHGPQAKGAMIARGIAQRLYFFAAIDDYIGYESPVTNPDGEWPKGRFVVKYAKSINFETFQTCMLVGDEDEQLTEPELEITFSECGDDEAGIKMLCTSETAGYPDHITLLQLASDAIGGIEMENRTVDLLIKNSDLGFGNWKKAKAILR